MFFKKKEKEIKIEKENVEKEETKKEKEWIWVDGYKGFDKDLKCNNFQYKVGEIYQHDGELKLCESGFHFCKRLEDVFLYYPLMSEEYNNRFCFVSGLVKKLDYDSLPEYTYGDCFGNFINSKIVAKEIKIVSELTYEDLKEFWIDKMIESESDSKSFNGKNEYNHFIENKVKELMSYFGFGELYSTLVIERLNKLEDRIMFPKIKKLSSLLKENISKEMVVYLIETKILE